MRKILLCDDSKAVHAMMKTQLDEAEYEVVSAFNAAELIAKLETTDDISIVFLDWEMPKVTGLKALGFLRQSGWSLPIFMLTGNNSESHIQEANRLGATGYIMKPFTEGLLIEALKKV